MALSPSKSFCTLFRTQPDGVVDVDDMFVGGVAPGRPGRSTKQVPCLIAVSLDTDAKPKFMRVTPVSGWDQLEMSRRVLEMVDVNATVETDGMGGFNYLHRVGYQHVQTVSAHLAENEHFSPVLHTQMANLKTEIQGTYHRRPSDRHIASYFHEYCFRFNRRNMRVGIMDRLLNACALSVPLRAANRPADHPCRWLCSHESQCSENRTLTGIMRQSGQLACPAQTVSSGVCCAHRHKTDMQIEILEPIAVLLFG